MDLTNNTNNHEGDSTDDDLSNHPVNLSTTITRHQLNTNHSKQQGDSGIELDKTSSSSTICNQGTPNTRLLFSRSNRDFDATSQPSVLHHLQKHMGSENENIRINQNQLSSNVNKLKKSKTYWNHLKQNWFRSFLIGLFILLSLFLIYLSGLDRCSRSAFIQSIFHNIIRIESEGLPTF